MAAYVVVDIEITDPDAFQQYVSVAGPIVAKYGGRLLAAGPPVATLEGGWHPTGCHADRVSERRARPAVA